MAQTIKLKRSGTSGRLPTTSDLELGEVAINTYDGKMYIKKNVGGTESIVEIGGQGGGIASSFTLYEYTATASQTTFSGSDSNSNTLAYDTGTPPKILVYLNGVLLDHSTDYTATNGTSVVLTSAAAASDLVQIAAYESSISTTLDIDLSDNQKLLLGDDDDLQLYHDGSNSYIDDAGTGNLRIRAGNLQLQRLDGTQNYLAANTGAEVVLYYAGNKKFETTNDGVTVTGDIEADEFIGDVRGAVLFKAQAGEALSKGDVVYISGISGNTTIVSKADADDASKMPAFGLVAAAASSGNPVDIYTNGILSGIDTSSYSEGDELFVSTTAGALTATAPTGESAALQKIGKVTRSNATSGSIFIVGAGRSNAVPNLDNGDIFIGNASNQAVTQSLTTAAQNAGALMDSEVTNLAQVKAFDSSDYATAAQGTTADSAMQDLVDDTTPQLGGDLDLNSNNITGTGNVNITGTVTSGNISVANITTSTASIFSDTPFAFLTTSTAAQNIRTKSVFAGTSYGDTPPAGSFNATNTYELNGVTIVDSSANLTNIGTISSGAITATKSSSHTTGTISPSNATLDLYNSLESDTDEKGSIITFTDNYYDGSNYNKTTRAAIKGGTDTTGNTANGFLAFYTDSSSANTANERMRIDFNGNFDFKSGNFSNVGTISSGSISTSGTITGDRNQNSGYIHKLTNTNTGTSAYTEFTVESGTQELRIGTSQNYSDGQWDGSWVYAAAGDLFLKSENAHVKMYAGGSVTPKWTFNTDGSIKQGDYNGSTFVDSSRNITAGTISSGAITASGSSVFSPTSDMVIINEPTSNTDLQTALRVGTASGGLYLTTDNAIISKGAYYDGAWIATATTGASIDLTANNRITFNTFSGATVGGTAAFGARAYIDSSGLNVTGTISSGAITSSASVIASGNSNSFGNTTITNLSATTVTTSGSIIASGNSNSFGNITTTGYLRGPSTFTIDPATHGDNTGTVVIAGNLQVDGTTTTINSTTLTVDDKNITLASGSSNAAAANGAGITVDCGSGTDATLTYDGTNDEWDFNKNVKVSGSVGVTNIVTNKVVKFNGTILDDSSITDTGSAITLGNNTTVSGTLSSGLITSSGGSSGRYTGLEVVNTTNAAGTETAIGLGVVSSGNNACDVKLVANRVAANSGSDFYIEQTDSSGVQQERFRIREDGNVGIGNTNPGYKLDITGNINIAGAGAYLRWQSGDMQIKNEGSYKMGFYTYNSSDAILNRRMVIDTDGNVGIGTASPDTKLDVDGLTNGGIAFTASQVEIDGSTSLPNGRIFYHGSRLIYDSPSNGHFFAVAGNQGTNIAMSISSSQNVGVGLGTTAPVSRFQVEVAGIDTTTTTTTATTQVAIDTFAAATFRSARYTIQVTNSTDSTYHITEILLIHDGTTPQITEYGTIFTGSAEATFDADISSGNVRLLATPATTDSMTFKVVRHCITV